MRNKDKLGSYSDLGFRYRLKIHMVKAPAHYELSKRALGGSQKTKALQYHLSTITDEEEYTFLHAHPEERHWV